MEDDKQTKGEKMDEAPDAYVAEDLDEDEDLGITVGVSPTRELQASPPRVEAMEVDESSRSLKGVFSSKYGDILELLLLDSLAVSRRFEPAVGGLVGGATGIQTAASLRSGFRAHPLTVAARRIALMVYWLSAHLGRCFQAVFGKSAPQRAYSPGARRPGPFFFPAALQRLRPLVASSARIDSLIEHSQQQARHRTNLGAALLPQRSKKGSGVFRTLRSEGTHSEMSSVRNFRSFAASRQSGAPVVGSPGMRPNAARAFPHWGPAVPARLPPWALE